MLNQIVFTRCSPSRSLVHQGQIETKNEGFGVRSCSKELFNDGSLQDYNLVLTRIRKRNASKEGSAIGLIDSYDYIVPDKGQPILGFEYQRRQCKRRSGIFVKQYLVGKMKKYPCEFIGSSMFTAHLADEDDFYSETNATFDFLKPIEEENNGVINKNSVNAFVKEGRGEVVKKMIWAIWTEMQKPASQRKCIIIKDTPENVGMWVAAVHYVFPIELASQISFSTNQQINIKMPNSYQYFVDKNGLYANPNPQNHELEKRMNFMMVGIHPKDINAQNVRPMLNASYYVVDGQLKKADFECDANYHRHFFSDSVQYGQDLSDFHMILDHISGFDFKDLLDLYDAYLYLFDSRHQTSSWQYLDTVKNFDVVTKFSLKSGVILKILVKNCLDAYAFLAVDDEKNQLKLASKLFELISILSNPQLEAKFKSILSQRASVNINNLNFIGIYWRLCKKDVHMKNDLLTQMFGYESCVNYIQNIRRYSKDNQQILLEILNEYIATNQKLASELKLNHICVQLLSYLLVELSYDPNGLRPYVHQYSMRFLGMLTKQMKQLNLETTHFSKVILDTFGNDVNLYIKADFDYPFVEQVLICDMQNHANHFQENLNSIEILNISCPSVGERFLKSFISNNQVNEKNLRNLQKSLHSKELKKYTMAIFDKQLSFVAPSRKETELANIIDEWSFKENIPCPDHARRIETLSYINKEKNANNLKKMLLKLKENPFSIENTDELEYAEKLLGMTVPYCQDMQYTALLHHLFDMNSVDIKKEFTRIYLTSCISCAGKNADGIASLLELLASGNKVQNDLKMDGKLIDFYLDSTVIDTLAKHYSSSFRNLVLNAIDDAKLKVKVNTLFDKVEEQYNQQHHSNFNPFKGLFKRK